MDMARGQLRLSQKPRLTPTTSMATATPHTAMATTERGLLMLSQKPRLIPMSSTTPTDTMDMARGQLRLSQKPRLTPTTSMATATPPIAMATTERGLLRLSPRPIPTTCTAMDIQLTDMSTESNQQEANFPLGPYKILACHMPFPSKDERV